MAANECIPYYEPGDRITGHAVVALTGKRFCDIDGNIQSGPGLATTAEGGNVTIGKPTAAGRVFGVVSHDVAIGGKVTVLCDPGMVVPVETAGVIAAFAEVEVDAEGRVVTKAAGVAVGFVLTGAGSGAFALEKLY
jgi:hypothetical protein